MRRFISLIGLAVLLAVPATAAEDHQPVAKLPLHACPYLRGGNATGPVTVGFTITKQGNVANPVIAQSSGSAEFDSAALTCVQAWTYEPATKDGVPVDWPAHVTLRWDHANLSDVGAARRIPGRDYEEKTTMTNVTPEIAKSFDRLIVNAQTRCPRLYPVRPLDMDRMHSRNRVVVRRGEGGAVEALISQSSITRTADDHALRCAKYLAGEDTDLPPVFAVEIEIDWALYYRPQR